VDLPPDSDHEGDLGLGVDEETALVLGVAPGLDELGLGVGSLLKVLLGVGEVNLALFSSFLLGLLSLLFLVLQ